MRRFSDQNSLVTLSDINVTPLLDLAFVLLIIFMITTPFLEQGLNLDLPSGGTQDVALDPDQIRVIEITAEGNYFLDQQALPFSELSSQIADAFQSDPEIAIYIRADKTASWEMVAGVVDLLSQLGIPKVSMRTEFASD